MNKTIEVHLKEGEKITCPNCGGTGTDKATMICVLCAGDGVLGEEETEE